MKRLASVPARLVSVFRGLFAIVSLPSVACLALLVPWLTSDALRESDGALAVFVLAIVLVGVTVLVIGGAYTGFLAVRAEFGGTNFLTYVSGVRRRRIIVPLGAFVGMAMAAALWRSGDPRASAAALSLAGPTLYATLWALRPPRSGAGETLGAVWK